MKKIHRKVIQLQASKFDKLMGYVKNLSHPLYSKTYMKNYHVRMFPNGLNPNSVARNSKRLKPSIKAKIIRKDIFDLGELWSPHSLLKDAVFLQVTGIDAHKRRTHHDVYE